MAGTKYAYVKSFELPDTLLPGTFIVVRVDGHSFHRFTEVHNFAKANDERGLQLMDRAARDVMDEWKDIILCFGESDEYSFLFRRSTNLYNRKQAKIITTLVSKFTASYIFHWGEYFTDVPLAYPPTFDARVILYPGTREVRDYFSWRQADTHINNLYNTTFWALIEQGGETTTQAHASLRGTNSSQKNEILFSRFGINYSEVPERFRKGSVLVRADVLGTEGDAPNVGEVSPAVETDRKSGLTPALPKRKSVVRTLHVDIIRDDFWNNRSALLED